jgi:hypothetical protein
MKATVIDFSFTITRALLGTGPSFGSTSSFGGQSCPLTVRGKRKRMAKKIEMIVRWVEKAN